MSKRSIDPVKLLDLLQMNLPLAVFENLIVEREEGRSVVEVSVKPDFYREHRLAAKTTINQIRDRARHEGLKADYEPRGRWLEVKG